MNLTAPQTGYISSKLKFSDHNRSDIDSLFYSFNKIIQRSQVDALPFSNMSFVKNLSKKDLIDLLKLKPRVSELANSILKFDKTIEFNQIKYIIDTVCPFYIKKYDTIHSSLRKVFYEKLRKSLNEYVGIGKELSKNINKNHKNIQIDIDNYLNAKEFDSIFHLYINEEKPLEIILSFESDFESNFKLFFKNIRHSFLFKKAKVHELIKKNDSNIIDLEVIKSVDPIAYALLRSEAFSRFCEKFNISLLPQKSNWISRVRPSDRIGQIFKLSSDENLIFSISTERIPSFKLAKNSKIKDKGNMTYIVSSDQEDYDDKVILYHKYDEDTNLQIQMRVYFSFQKLSLTSNLTHKSIVFIE